jgi:hypothetical protein
MKITEGLKIIENGWIKKPKGFRVSFQKTDRERHVRSRPFTAYRRSPVELRCNRLALCLEACQSTPLGSDAPQEGDMVNIFVVDQDNQPILYYATGKKEIFNEYSVAS